MRSCHHGIGLRADAVVLKKAGGVKVACRTASTPTTFIARTIQEEEGGCPQQQQQATTETAAAAIFIFIQACFVALYHDLVRSIFRIVQFAHNRGLRIETLVS